MRNGPERRKIKGEWVKALRKDLNLSQKELAVALGVSRSAVARWEANTFRPTLLAAKVMEEFAERARGPQADAAQGEASPMVEPHVPYDSHSQNRGSEHEPGKPGSGADEP